MTLKKGMLSKVVSSSIIRKSNDIKVNFTDEVDESGRTYTTLAPYDDPKDFIKKNISNSFSLNKKEANIVTFKMLSATEIKLIKYLSSKINKDGNTLPIYLSKVSEEIGHSIASLKKICQRLETKGFLKRVTYKSGRGGWTIYSVSKDTKEQLEKIEPN